MDNKETKSLTLPDGRQLSYASYGDENGRSLFFFHGGNDSRLVGRLLAKTAKTQGIHIIAPDRPGYGRSTFLPNRRFLDWADDISFLADQLKWDYFALLGHSGGGPHVAAVAHQLPQRITTASFISSAAPPGSSNQGLFIMFRIMNFAMGHSPWIHQKMTENQVYMLQNNPEKMMSGWARMSAADGRLFETNPEAVQIIIDEMREAINSGIDGILLEHPLYKQPWEFDLAEIRVPTYIWHGKADVQAAPAWSQFLAEQIPESHLNLVADEGHFSLLVNQQEQILELT